MRIGLFTLGLGAAARPEVIRAVAETAERTGVATLWAAEHVVLFDRYASSYPYSPTGAFPLGAEAIIGKPGSALYSEPFPIPRRGNVEIEVEAPLQDNWLYLDGALINEESGELHEFDTEVSYYSGPDWSEGRLTAASKIGRRRRAAANPRGMQGYAAGR